MRSRRQRSSPFSLFAFQDTMTLALELVANAVSAPAVVTPAIADKVASAVEENAQEITRLQEIVDESSEAISLDAETARKRIVELVQVEEELKRQNESLGRELLSVQSRRQTADMNAQTVSQEVLQRVKEELEATHEQLRELRASNRVIFNRPDGATKAPWLVQIESGSILAAESGKNARPRQFATPDEFMTWARTKSSSSVYFVLLLKPDGIQQFGLIRSELQSAGFDIGYDLLEAELTAIDSQTGADVP